MKLPNCDTPLPDENFYSYLYRMLELNGIDMNTFCTKSIDSKSSSFRVNSFYARRVFLPLYNVLSVNQDPFSFFLSLTTYPFDQFFLSKEDQTRYIGSYFQVNNKSGYLANWYNEAPKICPCCHREDIAQFGNSYFHRVHQLCDIKFCPKHNVRLSSYIGKRAVPSPDICLDEFAEIKSELQESDLISYAQYAEALLHSCIHADLNVIRSVVTAEFSDRGYTVTNNYKDFYADLMHWEHKSLFPVSDATLFFWLDDCCDLSPGFILGLLMFLYQDPLLIIEKIKRNALDGE